MKKLLIVLALVVGLTAACSPGNNFRDLEGVDSKDPDKAEFYNNVDQHPNIGRLCIDGVAFATTTRDYEPILRVPEWDDWCGEAR